MDGRWVSPNDMFLAAQRMMLDGREPASEEDWFKVVNFFAANIATEVALSGVRLMCLLYNCPLTDVQIAKITEFQIAHKEAKDETVDCPAVVQGAVPAPGAARPGNEHRAAHSPRARR